MLLSLWVPLSFLNLFSGPVKKTPNKLCKYGILILPITLSQVTKVISLYDVTDL